jgi:polysaccharide deacetylase family protein (PEP-CTERM system associated)
MPANRSGPTRSPNGEIVNVLTIDVEDYFHPNALDGSLAPADWDALPQRAEANTHRILDLLDEFDVRATFFVVGWIAERHPALVREIAARHHEVACHGFDHRLVYRLGPDGFREDVRRAQATLEDRLGQRVRGFRAATYSIVADTLWALDILIEAGFEYDSSIFPVHHDLYGIPGFSRQPVRIRRPAGEILEIPASTLRLLGRNWPIAGGGYFRILPYALNAWAIRHLNRREQVPAIVYLHPWELDPEQPRLAVRGLTRFRMYTNLERTEGKVRRLLADFRFGPIESVLRHAGAAQPQAPLGP